ncbi:hypothetical protein P3X46_011831 [Hevea brasiliensis]|uniref:DUF4378 domain-containing protein n=1 Tax=Hevea brasiliensis TaxID=3981 RepID=A0ABQ9M8B9_HEVBR|nr:uncharacterized protein LOC110649722 isoform X2 [Hevea brasiliensis]XP_058005830.1 uncharacterized protein LOC110649722 isoform X2 [Hevea brasiliensis]KAJ9176527.1 hypothetical protein P3X46_011831 [Hevea brasiliensis]
MNVIQGSKAQNIEKPFPGCLGRMVNLFDLSNGATGNRLLTDKPHGSLFSRSRSDVARMLSLSAPFADQIEDKMIVSELRRSSSNKKASGTPIKTLIAQEMSKEVDSRHNPPNVVAKLMGLDTLPLQLSNSAAERSHSKGYSRRSLSHSGILEDCWEQDNGFLDKRMHCEEQNEYKDVYEIWQQSQKTNVRDSSPHKGRHTENTNEKKMTLVREKFMEAKRLATDEKGRQSKEFQDALEILSSNRDLFLKFLQEPNSMFSPHLYDMCSIPPPPETKRITVLRPSKAIDNEKFAGSGTKCDKQANKPAHTGQAIAWDKNNSGCSPTFANQRFEEYPAQPTRIVVLKPSPGKTHDVKAVVSPPTSSPRILQGEEFYDEAEDDEAQESREVAKEITSQMRGNLMFHRRDETLLSSVFSNGYVGDDSSFNKSENEYAVGNLSDSEIMSPTSRHSWDYINRFGSPYSCSSFSRASCSPESSVCREAKKRLSERWAMMTSNGSSLEQKNTRRSSSTLGEMLALSDARKSVRSEAVASIKEQEPRGSTSCLTSNLNKEEGMVDSPKSLLRSRSVPASSTVYGAGLNVEVSDSQAGRTEVSKELTKAKSTKLSLKGKVSSLFFSRNKKSNKEKSSGSQTSDEHLSPTPETPGSPMPLHGKTGDDSSQCTNNSGLEDCLSPGLHGPSNKTTYPDLIAAATKQGFVSQEAPLSVAKPVVSRNMSENQDQPSPISVLEPPFEEDDNTIPELSGNIRPNCRGAEVPLKSNLIDKSPRIESIARTMSWDDSCLETATPYSLKPSSISSYAEEEEQEDWPALIQTLLSAAGLDGNMQLDSFFARWHSHDSPLDQALRNKYANLNDKELLHEAKRRQRRSNRKLVFDCVNAALLEITECGSDMSTRGMPCTGAHARFVQGASPMLVEHLWAQMKEWFCGEVRCTFEDSGDSSRLVLERVVRKEVVGKGWSDNMRAELDNLGKEIEDILLAELVEDSVADLTSWV